MVSIKTTKCHFWRAVLYSAGGEAVSGLGNEYGVTSIILCVTEAKQSPAHEKRTRFKRVMDENERKTNIQESVRQRSLKTFGYTETRRRAHT